MPCYVWSTPPSSPMFHGDWVTFMDESLFSLRKTYFNCLNLHSSNFSWIGRWLLIGMNSCNFDVSYNLRTCMIFLTNGERVHIHFMISLDVQFLKFSRYENCKICILCFLHAWHKVVALTDRTYYILFVYID